MSKVRFNPEINLGHILQGVLVLMAMSGIFVGLKLQVSKNAQGIQNHREQIQELKAISANTARSLHELTMIVGRIDERTRRVAFSDPWNGTNILFYGTPK
jgi:hypothetical protein